MQRTRLAVAIALALVGCVDDPDIIMDTHPPDVIVNYDCPCVEGLCEHVVNITEEVYPTETVYVTEEDTTPDVVQEFYGDTADLPVLLWSGIGAPMPKKTTDLDAATELNDADEFVIAQSGTSKRLAASVFWVPTNYIGGLITSNDAGDADHDIAIAPGIARSDDDAASLKLAAILTKQIDATWAVGDDAGGMEAADHPVQASTLYALWLIKRSDTGVVDAMFSLDFSSPTLPTDYDYKRLIAAVRTSAGTILKLYTQVGDFFRYTDGDVELVDTSLVSGTWEDHIVNTAPPNSIAKLYGGYSNPNSTGTISAFALRPKGAGDASTGAFDMYVELNTDIIDKVYARTEVFVPADQTIQYKIEGTIGATDSIDLTTYAFTMLTRSNP